MHARILIADDHEDVRSGIRDVIVSCPEWEICGEARSGQEALEAAKRLQPDVMILDITMPDMNGLEVAREIARLNLSTRVLICSTHASRALDEVVRDVGAQGYALKSCAGSDLVAAVQALMEGGTFSPEVSPHRFTRAASCLAIAERV